jgi:hypothetical protein
MLLAGLGVGALASQLGSVTVSAVPDEQSGEVDDGVRRHQPWPRSQRRPLGGEDLTRYAGPPRLIRAAGTEPFDTIADGVAVTGHPEAGSHRRSADGHVCHVQAGRAAGVGDLNVQRVHSGHESSRDREIVLDVEVVHDRAGQ